MLKKITFIKPNIFSSHSKGALQPLFAAALAAHTPEGIETCLYDDRIENIPYDDQTDLVAINIETFAARRAYQIASEFRKRGVKVVAGGYHPTLCPEEALEFTDAILTGDAEELWPELLNDCKNGKLKRRYDQKGFIDPEKIKFRRSIFKNKNYGPIEMVQWGRGCPYDCEFCSIKSFYRKGQLCRSADDVAREVSELHKKIVFFVDDNLFHDRKKLIHFLNEIKPLKIKWVCQISISIAQDTELLHKMADSGCFVVLIGIESFHPNNLKLMNKSWNIHGMEVSQAIKTISSFGIFIYGTFIFGYDHDTGSSFKQAVEFATKHNFFLANFNPLYPLPGSKLYQRYEKENRLIKAWWTQADYYYGKSMFEPKGMSAESLEISVYEAKRQFNSWSSILRRGGALLRAGTDLQKLALFIYSNYINRSEVINKQGKRLGA